MKDYLIEKLTNIDHSDILKKKKDEQLKQIYNKLSIEKVEEYNNLIYKDISPENIIPKLQFVETTEEKELFDYYRNITSSVYQSNIPGRVVQILVYDTITAKYIGLLQLTVDLLVNKNKCDYFGINEKDYNRYKKKLRDSGANISICIPLQPFGFNFCGGKLLAMLAFSKEVYDYYYTRFNIKLKYLITLSLSGKSIQYSRLKQLKFVGYTAGCGLGHLSQDIIDLMKIYLEETKTKNINRMSNHTITTHAIKQLDLPSDIIKHNQKRGIYIGVLGQQNFIKNKTDKDWMPDLIESVDTIYKAWLSKHALKRKQHLLTTDRFITR